MGLFDNAVQDAVPGGNLAKPIMIAIGALLLNKMLSRGSAPEAEPEPQAQSFPPQSLPPLPGGAGGGIGGGLGGAFGDGGGLLGGLGELVSKFQKAGHGQTVDSWIGNGPNQPIQPGQLGGAIGQSTISDIAQRSGMSEQELLAQLSQVLPQLINKLTPNGRLPTEAELSGR